MKKLNVVMCETWNEFFELIPRNLRDEVDSYVKWSQSTSDKNYYDFLGNAPNFITFFKIATNWSRPKDGYVSSNENLYWSYNTSETLYIIKAGFESGNHKTYQEEKKDLESSFKKIVEETVKATEQAMIEKIKENQRQEFLKSWGIKE